MAELHTMESDEIHLSKSIKTAKILFIQRKYIYGNNKEKPEMIRIHALQTGTVMIKTCQLRGRGQGAGRMLNTLTGSEWTPSLPIYAWVIEHPEGVIVVDTGETARTSEAGYFPRWHPFHRLAARMSVRPEDEIGPQLQRLGISPREVRQVILTHFHTDH